MCGGGSDYSEKDKTDAVSFLKSNSLLLMAFCKTKQIQTLNKNILKIIFRVKRNIRLHQK